MAKSIKADMLLPNSFVHLPPQCRYFGAGQA
jgi:hypothetical protein